MATIPERVEPSVTPSTKVLAEALHLAEELLRELELGEVSLARLALKASRLARLLNDFDMQKTMQFESSGYPCELGIVPLDAWNLGVAAGRDYFEWATSVPPEKKQLIYVESIEALEAQVRGAEVVLSKITDTPKPTKPSVFGGDLFSDASLQRGTQLQALRTATDRLASRRALIHTYVARCYYELKYSGIASDVFTRIRERVDKTVANVIPDAVQRFTAVYENLLSDSREDWSNAVHGCRRILLDLSDAVFPATDQNRVVQGQGGKTMTVRLGQANYVNRLVAFVGDRSSSPRFSAVVGSQIAFIGNRLDAIVDAVNKGTHSNIITREEADRIVVYTYLLVGDILSLLEEPSV